MGPTGPYQLQAAIAALHDEAPSAEATDWPQILAPAPLGSQAPAARCPGARSAPRAAYRPAEPTSASHRSASSSSGSCGNSGCRSAPAEFQAGVYSSSLRLVNGNPQKESIDPPCRRQNQYAQILGYSIAPSWSVVSHRLMLREKPSFPPLPSPLLSRASRSLPARFARLPRS
jgi:hypothetical protein